ncbi:hypothetical protein [Variovorax sp. PvP013]|uniref:hypothetical protein n=1 Tax=Variovorax sp. PvP013 TaxID=3156435 RepID=UPI003D248C60
MNFNLSQQYKVPTSTTAQIHIAFFRMNYRIFYHPSASNDSHAAIATLNNVQFKNAEHYIDTNNIRILNDVSIIFSSETDLLSALKSGNIYELHTDEGKKLLITISQQNGLTKNDANQYTMYASEISTI